MQVRNFIVNIYDICRVMKHFWKDLLLLLHFLIKRNPE